MFCGIILLFNGNWSISQTFLRVHWPTLMHKVLGKRFVKNGSILDWCSVDFIFCNCNFWITFLFLSKVRLNFSLKKNLKTNFILKQVFSHRTFCVFSPYKVQHTDFSPYMITLYPDVNLEVSRFWSDSRLHDSIIWNNEPILPRGGGSPDVGMFNYQGTKIWFLVGWTVRLHHCKLHGDNDLIKVSFNSFGVQI